MSAADDAARFDRLVRMVGSRVLAYLARRTVPASDAADVYQEVLVTTWRKLDRVPDDDDAALGWLFATARRCLANHRRGTGRRLAATLRLRDQLAVTPSALDSDAGEAVRTALADLGDDDRELVTLVYWDGLSVAQAGTVLGISAVAARKRLSRARGRLAESLACQLDEPQPRAVGC